VTRAKPPSSAYPVPAAYPSLHQSPTASIFRMVLAALCSPVRRFLSWLVQPSTTWWRPLVHRRWLHHNMDYRTRHFILYPYAPTSRLTKCSSTKHRYSEPSDLCLQVIPSHSSLSPESPRPTIIMTTNHLRTRYSITCTSRIHRIARRRLPHQTFQSWSSSELFALLSQAKITD
jgi:hypothetical protein